MDQTIVQVAMDGRGVLSRRGFLRGLGLGAAGLSALSFTDLLAARADDLRRRQMACILLWMGGGRYTTFRSFATRVRFRVAEPVCEVRALSRARLHTPAPKPAGV